MTDNSQLFKKTLLASFIALSLTACGGGGSSSGGGNQQQTDDGNDGNDGDSGDQQPVLQTVSGKAADGYLVDAKVCLDLNNNSVCDDGEPTATSTEGGEFVINDIPEDVDLSTVRVVVEIIPNVTIDEDNPDETIEQAYTLTAPPGQPEFVSPLTTIIDTLMQNDDGLTIEEAEDVVKVQLDLPTDSEVSLFEDYVAEKANDNANKDQYERLHVVAQVVTDAISNNLGQASVEAPELGDEEQFGQTLNAVLANVEENLEDLVSSIDEIIDGAGEGEDIAGLVRASEAIEQALSQIELTAEEIEDKVEQLDEVRNADQADIQSLLTEGEGFFFLDTDDDYNFVDECTVEVSYEYGYEQFKLVDGSAVLNEWVYDNDSQGFVAVEGDGTDDEHQFYQLTSDGWSLTSEGMPEIVSFSESGETAVVLFPGLGSREIEAKALNASGKNIKSVASVDEGWAKGVEPDDVYQDGSIVYALSMKQLEDVYHVPVYECEMFDSAGMSTGTEDCNKLWMPSNDPSQPDNHPTALDEIINTNWDGDFANLAYFYMHDYAMAFVEETDAESGDVNRYSLILKHNYDCHEDMAENSDGTVEESDEVEDSMMCDMFEVVDEGEWELETVSGQVLLHYTVSDEFMEDDDEFNGQFFSVVDGLVRMGMLLSEDFIWRDERALNETALNSVIAVFDGSNGVKTHDVCDDEHDMDDDKDEHDDDSDEDGGDEHDDDKEDTPPPVLIADAERTEMLVNTAYITHFMEDDYDETLLIQFKDAGEVTVFIVEEHHDDMDDEPSSPTEAVGGTSAQAASDEDEAGRGKGKDEEVLNGTWVVDAEGQLLLQFIEVEHKDDGSVEEEIDWVLFNIDGDIGGKLTLVEVEEDEEETMTFTKLDGLDIASIAAGDAISLTTDEMDTVCTIDLYFNDVTAMSGSGNVDATECEDIAEEDGEQFEFTWSYGDIGQIALQLVDGNGEMREDQVDFYQTSDDVVYTVSYGVEEEMDDETGAVEEDDFVSIEKWQVVTESSE